MSPSGKWVVKFACPLGKLEFQFFLGRLIIIIIIIITIIETMDYYNTWEAGLK